MTDKKFECGECGTRFAEALYWFDSLHFDNFDKRIIKPFCGPKCVQEWNDSSGAREWPNRSHPYPKGEEWRIISQIDWDIDYETD